MCTTATLTVLLLTSIVHVIQATDKYEDCKSTSTKGYGYKNIYHISESGNHQDNTFLFRFQVKAIDNAHILLSPTASPSDQDPVYEIVIGAGRNTFSDIRRQMGAQSKARSPTVDYLSELEYRGFWIHIGKNGLIEVGKAEEEDVPFLFWTDPQPLPIHYFSFCNWRSTVGSWLYSCANDSQSEEVDVPIPMTTIERLRHDLLLQYDPYSRPILDANDTTYIFMHLTCQNILLDEKKSVMSVRGEVIMHWEDQKLRWKPQDYDNISMLTILYHEVWQPEMILYNADGHGTDILTDTPMLVSSLGLVMWKSQANMKARCNLDLSQWPNDKQTCELQLGFWAQQEVLHLDLIGKGTKFEETQHSSSEWEVLSLEANPSKLKTPWINTTSDLKDNKALSIRLSLQRKGRPYMIVLAVPLIAFGTMTLLAFWISPLDSNKILLSCINLVIVSMLIVKLGSVLPAPANQVPVILVTYGHGMVAMAFSLVISVIVIGFTRYKQVYPLPNHLKYIITSKPLHIMLYLPSITKQESTDYEHLQEMGGDPKESSPNHGASTANCDEIQQQWMLLATVIDRLACLIYLIYLITVLCNQG